MRERRSDLGLDLGDHGLERLAVVRIAPQRLLTWATNEVPPDRFEFRRQPARQASCLPFRGSKRWLNWIWMM
jgi:hypothetical protein